METIQIEKALPIYSELHEVITVLRRLRSLLNNLNSQKVLIIDFHYKGDGDGLLLHLKDVSTTAKILNSLVEFNTQKETELRNKLEAL